MFSQIVKIPFKVEEYKKYEVDLCTNIIDYSKEPFKPRINQLKSNESFKIIFSSQGCFHSDERELIISRKRKKYFLEYEGKSKRLSKKELKLVEHFEIELLFIKEDYCTTSDIYNIQFKGKNDFYLDGSCKWNGLYYLMKNLGISNDKDY